MHLENVERALAIAMGSPRIDRVNEVLQRAGSVLLSLFGRGSEGQRRATSIRAKTDADAEGRLQQQALGIAHTLLGTSPATGGRGLLSAILPMHRLTGRQSDDREIALHDPVRFQLPEMLRLDTARTDDNGIVPVDYDLAGRPRISERANATIAPPSVTVQVNALDSRSFIERSDDIAAALKEALLHSHAVADFLMER